MAEIILEIVNVACMGLAVTGALILGIKGDKIQGWIVYTLAAILGVIYFLATGNAMQLVIWLVFLANDFIAIRRKTLERGKETRTCFHLVEEKPMPKQDSSKPEPALDDWNHGNEG